MNTYGEKLLSMRMIQIKSNKKQVLLLMINAFLEAFEFEAGVSVIRIAPPWFLSCTTRCKFTSLVPLLDLSWTTCCTTFVPLVVNLPLLYHSCTYLPCTTLVPLFYVPPLYHSCTTRCTRSILVNRAPLTVLSCVPTMILCQEWGGKTISCCNVCWLQQLII